MMAEATPDTSSKSVPAWVGKAAVFVLFAGLLTAFFLLATRKGAKDNSGIKENGEPALVRHDQQPYLNVARKLVDEHFNWIVPRHRMPGYSLMLIPFYDPDTAYEIDPTGKEDRRISEAFFERGKRFNIILAMAVLVALYFLSRRWMPVWEAFLTTWSFGFLLAVIKAPYVQPEIIFYLTFTLSFALLLKQLEDPTWMTAIFAGVALAATFILKSAVIPLIALFLACFGLKRLVDLIIEFRTGKRESAWKRFAVDLSKAAIIPVVFVALLSPYLRNTWKLYGSPFFDVHSKYYMWMDTDEEKRKWRDLDIAEPDFVKPENEELPGPAKYFREHEIGEMIERPQIGWGKLKWRLKEDYSPLYRLLVENCRWIVIIVLVLHWRETLAWLRKHWATVLMSTGFFLGYGLLYCWYAAIGVGPRLILGLSLPLIGLSFFLVGRFGGVTRIPKLGIQLNDRRIALIALTLATIYHSWHVVSHDLWIIEGGQ
ncbi:MAG: hypothetical protein KDN19_13435 [Verrucomicrobiae bacterium]|nr:hypothetical protein [Verrucomicrobiae bacterium]